MKLKWTRKHCRITKIIVATLALAAVGWFFGLGVKYSDTFLDALSKEPPCREICDRKHMHKRLKGE